MKPGLFHYHAPRTVEDALAALAAHAPEDGRILAGGQSLIPAMALRVARPPHLIDINGVAGFDRVTIEAGVLHIRPCVRHAQLNADAAPGPLGRLLGQVLRHIAHLPIRNRGTFCGSLANADPASEWCLLMATLGHEIEAASLRGRRMIPAGDFFQGFMATALEPDELLLSARLPLLADDVRVGFDEFARRAGDYAQAMAIATYALRDGAIVQPRIGLGGVEPAPRRMAAVEALLLGKTPSEAVFKAAAAAAPPILDPLEDTAYRRGLAETSIFRALCAAA
ncbi:FAD binding domain-containing protein [Humitalea sp. 24SJ18S-53]|uniref:FAD binding domain-containing protein n=1 Tax=Humitalea sp. 24SJ18S-53 TaxID=3422307 RepID=UPI003D666ED2